MSRITRLDQAQRMLRLNTFVKVSGRWIPTDRWEWRYSSWSSCKGACESMGTKTRSASCYRNGDRVDDKLCNHILGYPVLSSSCMVQTKCCTGGTCFLADPWKGNGGNEQTGTIETCLDKAAPSAGTYQVQFFLSLHAGTRKSRPGNADLLYVKTNTGDNLVSASGGASGISGGTPGPSGSASCSHWGSGYGWSSKWITATGSVRLNAGEGSAKLTVGIRTNSGGHKEKTFGVGGTDSPKSKLL